MTENLMTIDAWKRLRDSGMMWEIFPEFTGDYYQDVDILDQLDDDRKEAFRRYNESFD